MKKVFVFVLILMPCLPLVSLDLGIGVDTDVWVRPKTEGSFEATQIFVELSPALILMVTPQIEVQPFVVVGLYKQSDPDDIATWDADRSQLHFGLGVGLYYHFVQREIVSLCTGPKLNALMYFEPSGSSVPNFDSYINFEIQVELPLYLDIRVTKSFLFRMGLIHEGIGFSVEKVELSGVEYIDTTFFIDNFYPIPWEPLENVSAYFGFYFML